MNLIAERTVTKYRKYIPTCCCFSTSYFRYISWFVDLAGVLVYSQIYTQNCIQSRSTMSSAHRRPATARRKHSENGSSDTSIKTKHQNGSSFWSAVQKWDEKYTSICAVCANKNSALSHLRPVMKLVEISCHGIPWLLGTTVMILSVHQAFHVEILVNLFYGEQGLIFCVVHVCTFHEAFLFLSFSLLHKCFGYHFLYVS